MNIVHRCFGEISMVPGSVNFVAESYNNDIDANTLNSWKFSDVFAVFFPENGYRDDDSIVSWLNAIADTFSLADVPKPKKWIQVRTAVQNLFEALEMEDLVVENHSSYQFWMYLFMLHREILRKLIVRPRALLQFLATLTRFSIQSTKVVLIGFQNLCSFRMLPFLNDSYKRCVLNQPVITAYSFNRDYWTGHGVFFINANIPLGDDMVLGFARFLIRHINTTMENVVFVVDGNYAAKILHLIDQEKHCVIEVKHPCFTNRGRDEYRRYINFLRHVPHEWFINRPPNKGHAWCAHHIRGLPRWVISSFHINLGTGFMRFCGDEPCVWCINPGRNGSCQWLSDRFLDEPDSKFFQCYFNDLHPHKEWKQMMPFINSNFYRYQFLGKECEILDWCAMDNIGAERRIKKVRAFFRKAMEKIRHKRNNSVLYFSRPRQNIKIILSPTKYTLQYIPWNQ